METYVIDDAFRQKVLSNFFENGRLKSIPAQRKKRYVVLVELVNRFFETQHEYTEREVNDLLTQVNDDFCTLRRELIIEGLMTRDHGIYKRI